MIDFTVAVPLIVLVVSTAKTYGLPSQWSPFVALILGVAAFGLINGADTQTLLEGVAAGLSASGLYSGVKATIKG